MESRLALLETIPGFFFFQWLGFLLLRLTVALKKACRVNHLLLGLCKLNKLLLLPISRLTMDLKFASAEDKMDSKSLVLEEEEELSKSLNDLYSEGQPTKQRLCSVNEDSEHICVT